MKSATWKLELKNVMKKKCYEPLKLKSTNYFGFDMTVASNIYRTNIMDGIYTKKELSNNCTKRDGHGLTMELPNHYQQLITFHTFMTDGDSLIFYSRNLPSRMPQIRNVIHNVKDTKRIGPTSSRLLDEVFGIRISTCLS